MQLICKQHPNLHRQTIRGLFPTPCCPTNRSQPGNRFNIIHSSPSECVRIPRLAGRGRVIPCEVKYPRPPCFQQKRLQTVLSRYLQEGMFVEFLSMPLWFHLLWPSPYLHMRKTEARLKLRQQQQQPHLCILIPQPPRHRSGFCCTAMDRLVRSTNTFLHPILSPRSL